AASGIRAVVSHDSYLINLASPDEALRAKSIRAFTGELERCRALGISWVVSHPGNYIDDRTDGLARNARAYAECLAAVPGEVGLTHLKCVHLNDSKGGLGSRLDRHQWIGEGTIGPEPFRRIMRDPRLAPVIKIIETPKGDDPIRHDRRMLRRLRAYARGGRPNGRTAQTVGRA